MQDRDLGASLRGLVAYNITGHWLAIANPLPGSLLWVSPLAEVGNRKGCFIQPL